MLKGWAPPPESPKSQAIRAIFATVPENCSPNLRLENVLRWFADDRR
jgi:hypothetical protein